MTKRYRKTSNQLFSKDINEEFVIVNITTGAVHKLNPVASYIWQNLLEDKDTSYLTATFVEEFKVDLATAQRDVETFTAELVSLGLLDEILQE